MSRKGRSAIELTSYDPADGSPITTFPNMQQPEVDEVVEAARAARAWWQDQGFGGRARHLKAWRRQIWDQVDELAELIHQENGKPVTDAVLETVLAVEHIKWAEENAGRVLAARRVSPGLLFANFKASVRYAPLGVVGVISPWNYPLYSPNSSVAFALAAGNTVVLKPSEYTPAVGKWYVDAFHAANPDVPAAVLQLVTGDSSTGAALCAAAVDKIGFTGSTATGRRIMAQCAETLTPVLLECGGKDPVIVAGDADLGDAAQAVAWGAFTNGGQTCVGVERVYVVKEVRDEFLDLVVDQLAGVRAGSDPAASYGPMTMPKQVAVVRRHIDDALGRGGTAVFGGPASVGERFIDPVVILDAPEDSAAVREETFGPTMTVTTVDDVDEAVRLANAHEYALSASVFSRGYGEEIASRLRAGQVSVNSVIAFAGMGSVPMGGIGASGFGRVHGDDGLREFVAPRSVVTKSFGIPMFEIIALKRARHVLPLLRRVISLRH